MIPGHSLNVGKSKRAHLAIYKNMNIKAKLIIIFLMTASCLNSTYAETQLVQESEINNNEHSNEEGTSSEKESDTE